MNLSDYYRIYYTRLLSFGELLTSDKDLAYDLTQQTFERALKYPYNPEFGRGVYGYLAMLLKGVYMDYLRARTAERENLGESTEWDDRWLSLSYNPILTFIEVIDLKAAIRRLGPLQREVLRLYLWGYTPTEIAQRLQVTDRSVRRWLIQIKHDLKLPPPVKEPTLSPLQPEPLRVREPALNMQVPIVQEPDGIRVSGHVGGAS